MEVICWSVGSIVDGVHASARRRRDADRASVAAGRPEASPGPFRQLSEPEKLPGLSGSFLRGQHKSTNRSNQIHILQQCTNFDASYNQK